MAEIKIYKSKWKAVKLIVLASPFVILSLSDILHYSKISPQWLDWVSLCFFGLGIPIGLFNILDPRPELVLNNEGIFDRMSYGIFNKSNNKGFVSWDSIKDAFVKIQQLYSPQGIPTTKQKFICLTLDEDTIAKLNRNVLSRKLAAKFDLKDYGFSLMNLQNFDEQKFVTFIKEMAQANIVQRQKLLTEFKL